MHFPWSHLTEEDYKARKRMFRIALGVGLTLVVVLLAVQIRVSFATRSGPVDHDPIRAGSAFLRTLSDGVGDSAGEAIDEAGDQINTIQKQNAAVDSVSGKIQEMLAEEEGDEVADDWTYESEEEETSNNENE